jgi:hypothetical protein
MIAAFMRYGPVLEQNRADSADPSGLTMDRSAGTLVA